MKKKSSPGTGKRSANKKRSPAPAGGVESADVRREGGLAGAESKVFPIVGVGASAGGLEALEELFDAMPVDTGMAFVVVTHQHPGHTSLLPELLGRSTAMTVVQAADGLEVAPNHVYVGAPGGHLAITNGMLQRLESDRNEAPKLPIDHFFRSLAEDRREHAVCIVLSGTGTDGTMGLKAIKRESGLAMVERPESAKYAGMPSSAIATGLADYVLAPSAMPEHLVAYTRSPYCMGAAVAAEAPAIPTAPIQKIFLLLRAGTGYDFSDYKSNTIRRRIGRRMNVHQIREPEEYVRFLHDNPREIDLLFRELLISVTNFFRDPAAWEALRGALEHLVRSGPPNHGLRVWVPGCATGEEAYSTAILLRECMDRLESHPDIQIFGTDLDAHAIESARLGCYPEGIGVDVSPERLRRFFIQDGSSYRICKDIREMVIFAKQNVIADPSFTKLDLISCRNLLIYLNAGLQKRLLPVFHYALRGNGLLLLGPSETIGPFADRFDVVDKHWKLFRRKESELFQALPMILTGAGSAGEQPATGAPAQVKESQLGATIERILLGRFAPASVVVTERGDIVYIHGRTGQYLEPAPGQPRNNILEMAREGLRVELTRALRACAASSEEVIREGVQVKSNGDFVAVDVTISKLRDAAGGLLLVIFRPAPGGPRAVPEAPDGPGNRDAAKLERELHYFKESQRATLEKLETSNEELKAANEELQSTNEELQSTNEELETSKEEMQALNEELATVNAELQSKVDELSQANDDMQNLLNSTDIATVFLDNQLKIKRFTEKTRSLIKLRQTDVGRPIAELASNLHYDDLVDDCREVLETLAYREKEVRSQDGSQFLMRILPYRTTENVIEGLTMTFVSIDRVKRAESALADSEDRLRKRLEERAPDDGTG